MKSFYKLISQLLIVSMVLLPFSAQAGMIGTDQAIASAQGLANRDKVRDFVNRDDVIKKFESLGLAATIAQERVDAMTQEELNRIAGKIDTLPAAGDLAGIQLVGTLTIAFIIGLIIWWVWKSNN